MINRTKNETFNPKKGNGNVECRGHMSIDMGAVYDQNTLYTHTCEILKELMKIIFKNYFLF